MTARDITATLASLLPAVIFLVVMVMFPIDTPITQPDSAGYIAFSALRTPGYPLVIWIVEAISGHYKNVVYFQVFFYCICVGYLSYTILSTSKSILLAYFICFFIIINPELNKYHFIVLTESLFISLTILICAEIIRIAYRFSTWRFVSLGLLIGFSISIRPIGYAFIPLIPIIFWVYFPVFLQKPKRILMSFLIPFTTILAIDTFIYSSQHGLPKKSLLAITAYGKAGLLNTDGSNPYSQEDPIYYVWQKLEDDVRPVRKLIQDAPSFAERNFLTKAYEVFLEFQFGNNEIGDAANASGADRLDVMKEVAFSRIYAAPGDYIKLSLNHYFGLWTIYGATHPSTVDRLNAYIIDNEPLPLAAASGYVTSDIKPQKIAAIAQPVFHGFGILSLFAAILMGFAVISKRIKPALIIAGLTALMVHGNYLLVALTGIGIMRYTLAMWPGIIVSIFFLAWSATEYKIVPRPEQFLHVLKRKLVSRP